jgi:hypothetical protein
MKRCKFIVISVVLFCLGAVVMAFITAAAQEVTGLITGIVIDGRGKPVAGAWVTIFCGDRAIQGRIPGALSDDRGHFAVGSLELGQCGVSACKEEEYVPCSPFAFVTHHPLQVVLTTKVPVVTVKVRLGEKGALISGMVRDAINGEAVDPIFVLRPLKFPDARMSMSSSAAFQIFIIPSTDYSFEVSAPGYKDWSYADHHNPHGPLRLAPRAHLHVDVQLEPLN